MTDKKASVADHYDGNAENYHLQYERNLLTDTSRGYPANYFRMHLLINSFVQNDLKKSQSVNIKIEDYQSQEPFKKQKALFNDISIKDFFATETEKSFPTSKYFESLEDDPRDLTSRQPGRSRPALSSRKKLISSIILAL